MIALFDLHCDTFLKLYKNKETFENNSLHISKDKSKAFSPYIQISAIWSECSLDNEAAYKQYKNAIEYSKGLDCYFATASSQFRENTFILGVEDARILCNDLSRLDTLYHDGVRILGLNWQGNTIIGGGWDTDLGLSDFGKKVVKKAIKLGMILDISHSSFKCANDVIELCHQENGSVIASHSNSYHVRNHLRNLTDELFAKLRDMGSLVGISLCTSHLSDGACALETILHHIEHYLLLGGENIIALGCDLDGITSLPEGFSSIEDLNLLSSAIVNNFGRDIAQKIFFENAYKFFCRKL